MSHSTLLKFLIPVLAWLVQSSSIGAVSNNNVSLPITALAASGNDQRIAGGIVAVANEYPWMAYLNLFTSSSASASPVASCSGTLINNRWVLTAATCLNGYAKIDVYLGAHNMGASSESRRVRYTSTTFTRHPSWNGGISNNIGLIKLPSSISFNTYIKAIALPTINDPDHVGDLVYLAGWGANNQGSSFLFKANSFVISNAQCQASYTTAITTLEMCSSGTYSGVDVGTCPGDNGSPMMYFQPGGSAFLQIGVSSFFPSSGCNLGYPSGFVRLRNYVDWIRSVSGAQALIAQSFQSVLLTAVTALLIALRNSV